VKDIRVEIRFKNNLLYKKIFEKCNSVSQFCKKNDLYPTEVGRYLNFKNTPMAKTKRGVEIVPGIFVKKTALKIADTLNCSLWDIFPKQLWDFIGKKYSIEIESNKFLPYNENQQLLNITHVDKNQKFNYDNINQVLSTLNEREVYIIENRFGLNNYKEQTLGQIARDLEISHERVRQIESKALRKLRHPSQLRRLRNR